MMVQRWRISSNSQRLCLSKNLFWRCLWWFKDEEFQAIHNLWCHKTNNHLGVYDGSKMKNFKQFTTFVASFQLWRPVFMMVQRWRISSNSQQTNHLDLGIERCLWWFKDEEFQAIHNGRMIISRMCMVFMMVQRWRISSNSQRRVCDY